MYTEIKTHEGYMTLKYDEEKLERAMSDFYLSTGIALKLLDTDLKPIGYRAPIKKYCALIQTSALGKRSCERSDTDLLVKCKISRKPEISICHAGLADIAVPIIHADAIIAYIILGQIKTSEDYTRIAEYARTLGVPEDRLTEYYGELTVYGEKRIESVSNLALMLAKYILLESVINPTTDRVMEDATEYIDSHLSTRISIEALASGINVSKSTLYKYFHEQLGCTVSEYVTRRRIREAEILLKTTDLSMDQIADRVGFSSAAYFTKNFKEEKGVTPLKYRKGR